MGQSEKKTEPQFCDMQYTRDENGKEILIKEGRFQVMMEWERPYMEACIDALGPSGDVLEIGFGCGYSSSHIQSYLPKSHTIIEYHPVVFEKAQEWAKSYENVILVQDTWQNALDSLGVFDAIFFDDYPLESGMGFDGDSQQVGQWSQMMEEKEPLMREARDRTAFLVSLKYTDEDLDAFFKELPLIDSTPLEYVLSFFCELREQNQITQMQQEYMLERYKKERKIEEGKIQAFMKQRQIKNLPERESPDRLSLFFNECAEKHMRSGSCFSCFISDPISKFQESAFLKAIQADPRFEYQQELMAIEVPDNCGYYAENQALVITITKL
ncbi:MAG: class I SAM-dependent methyltransferase [Simkania sp.]|nr:class I SAM-dependent methyltransferase [Simkania sp.]MCB1082706.1 class I SAM-dependent methyltransferase [Simkania sp.]MCP5490048.1 class I SAM-dependent methyltransferase [Chlamydiales bacterium]